MVNVSPVGVLGAGKDNRPFTFGPRCQGLGLTLGQTMKAHDDKGAACAAFVHVTLFVTPFTTGFSDFIASIATPIATGRSDSYRVGFSPMKISAFHGARIHLD